MTGEPKIGQKLKNASPAWEAQRAAREKTVDRIRHAETELAKFDKDLIEYKTAHIIDKNRPAFAKLTPENQAKGRAKIKLHISKPNKDGSPKTLKQILKEVEQAIAQWLKAQTEELERMAREAHARTMEAERQRLAALGGIPHPFAFSPSSSWGRAAKQAAALAATTPKDRSRFKR